MKKSMLTLAVVAASLPTLAMADATLYGSFRMILEKQDQKSMLLNSDSSRLGIKGSVDLGLEDTKGIFQWEQELDLNAGALNSTGGRYAHVGATGSWGTVKAGKLDHAFQLVNAYTEVLNSDQSRSTLQLRESTRRQGQSLQYVSPKMSGFQLTLDSVFKGDTDEKDKQVDVYGMGLAYDANNIYAALAYTAAKNTKSGGDYQVDQDAWGAALGYKIQDLGLRANYLKLDDETGGSNRLSGPGKATFSSLAATYDIGQTQLQLEYGYGKRDLDAGTNQKGQFTAVGVQQRLGKGRVYAQYHDFNKELYASTGDKFLVGYRLDF
ncbi:porin [Nitrincola tapanii]|uniref:Porin n=1 Tax=Nitrincola tapanii TaxID=1708751 RepID=A0A5A9W3P5_9GAMM|nr:porin [Nitrincola tapanii]KAA0875376.1 porin [Nitrincola tapanii]